MCIKIVPILLLPAFLFYIKGIKKRIIFLTSCLAIPIIVFIPYLMREYDAVVKNIFNYSSLKGIWGIGHLCLSITANGGLRTETRQFFYNIGTFHITYGVAVFLVIVVVLLKLFTDKKALNLTESIFLIFCMFLTITPGFGIQYLSWLSIFAVMIMPILGTVYICAGGLFLFRVYYYWCGGAAPYYANSDVVGQWVGFEKMLDLMVWAVVLAMLVKFIYQKSKIASTR